MSRVPVGYVRRAHGIAGATIVRPLTDDPQGRFIVGATFLTDGDPPRSVEIAEVRPHKDGLLVRFVEVADRSESEALRGSRLTIEASQRRLLEAGEFWPDDLIGCAVLDTSGAALGVVVEVVFGAAQERLAVETESGSRVEVPFVSDLVPTVDLDRRRIVLDPPAGLFG